MFLLITSHNMKLIKHHIIQRASNWSNHPDNLHTRDERLERAYHTVFDWVMLPVERIQKILNLDRAAYNPEVIKEIEKVVNQARWIQLEAYNPNCIKRR